METFVVGFVVGVALTLYFKSSSQKASWSAASNHCARLTLDEVELEIKHLEDDWISCGVLGEKRLRLMEALKFRKSELLRNQ